MSSHPPHPIAERGRSPGRPRGALGARALRHCGTWAALLAILFASGGHWVVLQTVAFGSMVVRYSQEAPLREALAKTFDGKHPCPLCHAIQRGRQQEEKQRPVLGLDPQGELALPEAGRCQATRPPGEHWLPALALATWHAFAQAPPKPPPKLA